MQTSWTRGEPRSPTWLTWTKWAQICQVVSTRLAVCNLKVPSGCNPFWIPMLSRNKAVFFTISHCATFVTPAKSCSVTIAQWWVPTIRNCTEFATSKRPSVTDLTRWTSKFIKVWCQNGPNLSAKLSDLTTVSTKSKLWNRSLSETLGMNTLAWWRGSNRLKVSKLRSCSTTLLKCRRILLGSTKFSCSWRILRLEATILQVRVQTVENRLLAVVRQTWKAQWNRGRMRQVKLQRHNKTRGRTRSVSCTRSDN